MNVMKSILLQILLLLLISIVARSQDQWTNNGNLQILPGASVTFFGDFKNNGTFVTGPTVTFSRDVVLSSGSTFTAGASIHKVAGNWTNNGGTFTPGLSTVTFNGSG